MIISIWKEVGAGKEEEVEAELLLEMAPLEVLDPVAVVEFTRLDVLLELDEAGADPVVVVVVVEAGLELTLESTDEMLDAKELKVELSELDEFEAVEETSETLFGGLDELDEVEGTVEKLEELDEVDELEIVKA